MNSQLIMKTDILDIVFEKRNKAYGAYELRKFYPIRLKQALGFMFIIAGLFAAVTLLPKKNGPLLSTIFSFTDTELKAVDIKPKEPENKPEAKQEKPMPVSKAVIPNQKRTGNRFLIVANSEKIDTVDAILPDDVISNVNSSTGPAVLVLVNPAQSQSNTGTATTAAPKIDKTKPFNADAVDILPSFPGGMEALQRFMKDNLQNPYDWENGETVRVQIKFVVGYNGKLQSFETQQDGGAMYNKEVIRVLKKMPNWVPGVAHGEKVAVYYAIPVKFVMSN